jgi:uncharacterized membrane protein YfhO
MTYTSNSSVSTAAIFSEIYYPKGWNCYIDGKLVENFRANYILRGAMIPAGSHQIIWKFEPTSFESSSRWSLIGSVLMLLLIIGVGTLEIRNLRSEKPQEV